MNKGTWLGLFLFGTTFLTAAQRGKSVTWADLQAEENSDFSDSESSEDSVFHGVPDDDGQKQKFYEKILEWAEPIALNAVFDKKDLLQKAQDRMLMLGFPKQPPFRLQNRKDLEQMCSYSIECCQHCKQIGQRSAELFSEDVQKANHAGQLSQETRSKVLSEWIGVIAPSILTCQNCGPFIKLSLILAVQGKKKYGRIER